MPYLKLYTGETWVNHYVEDFTYAKVTSSTETVSERNFNIEKPGALRVAKSSSTATLYT